MSSQHAPLPPSSAEQWGHCAGSFLAQQNLPDLERERTRLGNATHWVIEQVQLAYKTGTHILCDVFEGRQAPNGVIIDGEIVEGAQIYIDSVVEQVETLSARLGHDIRDRLLVEHRVHAPQIHPTDNWGTLDTGLYVPELGTLLIWDYKHGNRECSVEDNLQIANYLAGIASAFRVDALLESQITVVARIVQPFCYHARGPVREWTFTLSDLRGHWNTLHRQAHEALGPNPTLTSGPWCRDCKAVGKCAVTRKARYNFIELANAAYEMDGMCGADLATEYRILGDGLEVAKARFKAIEDELVHRVQRGETDSGLALGTSSGREKWQIPHKQVVALCGQLGVDATKDGVKTPKQTRDSAPKEVRPMLQQIMAPVVRRSPGKLKLVPADKTKVARAFQPKRK